MNNVNYNPEKLAYYSEENARERYENEKRRKLVDMAIRNQREPWERETPDLEGIVDISNEVIICPKCDFHTDELFTVTEYSVEISVCSKCCDRILSTT